MLIFKAGALCGGVFRWVPLTPWRSPVPSNLARTWTRAEKRLPPQRETRLKNIGVSQIVDMVIDMSIIMIMNIYITKDNQEFLRQTNQGLDGKPFTTMSGLINKLLNDYRTNLEGSMPVAPKFPAEPREGIDQIPPDVKLAVIKSPKDVEKAVKERKFVGGEANAVERNLCKIHGTPLDDRGKCLVKGCKYA